MEIPVAGTRVKIRVQNLMLSNVSGVCGGSFSASTGKFSTPNFPDVYPQNAYCVYKITVPYGKACIHFRNYSVDPLDDVSVIDGLYNFGVRLQRLVKYSVPYRYTVYLSFSSGIFM